MSFEKESNDGIIQMDKKPHSRFPMVQTYKINCQKNKIIGYESIKSSSETGNDPDEFVHVLLSHLEDYPHPVIVKIHDENSIFVQRELKAFEHLTHFENKVELICHFSCKDEKERWENPIQKRVRFCNNKTDPLQIIPVPFMIQSENCTRCAHSVFLQFFIFQYIQDAEMDIFIIKNSNNIKVIKSLYLQTAMMLIILYETFHMLHGDLNTGNLLVGPCHEETVHYRSKGIELNIQSHGIKPLLIDWGRSYFLSSDDETIVIQDVLTILSIMTRWIKNKELQNTLFSFLKSSENVTHTSEFMNQLESLFL